MKTKFTIICLFAILSYLNGFSEIDISTNSSTDSDKTSNETSVDNFIISIVSNVNLNTTVQKQTNSGNGTLGLQYKGKKFRGYIVFNVLSQKINNELDTTGIKSIGYNLLQPQNYGQGLSNFYFNLNYNFKEWFGTNGYVRVNNLDWSKNDISYPVSIFSWGIYGNYYPLTALLEGTKADYVLLDFYLGFTGRYIGGDLGLEKNDKARKDFIGVEDKSFIGFEIGSKLQISNFVGSIGVTYFGKGEIAGFSGWQTTINLGLVTQLNIKANKVKRSTVF